MSVRIEATCGPVVLLVERDTAPKAGDRFRVAVFVADRALGTATLTYEEWSAFCACARTIRTGPCDDYQPDPDTVVTTACKRCGAPYGSHR